MNYTFIRILISLLLGGSILMPAFAMAQRAGVDAAVGANAAAGNTSVRATVAASSSADSARYVRAKDKAGQEIDRRISALTSLQARIAAMTKINDTLKSNITTNINTQISALAALKIKIDADTDGSVLREDVKTITQAYRVYVLLIPQARITAAADRIATILNMMLGVGTKLQARIQTEKNAGKNTAALEASLQDLGTKITSAQTHAQAAITLAAPLVPDNGDKDKMAANLKTLKDAQAELQAAYKDVQAARADIGSIIKGLKNLSINASSSLEAQ